DEVVGDRVERNVVGRAGGQGRGAGDQELARAVGNRAAGPVIGRGFHVQVAGDRGQGGEVHRAAGVDREVAAAAGGDRAEAHVVGVVEDNVVGGRDADQADEVVGDRVERNVVGRAGGQG